MVNERESVKVDSKIVKRVKLHVIHTKQTIGGFIDLTLDKELARLEKRRQISIDNKIHA